LWTILAGFLFVIGAFLYDFIGSYRAIKRGEVNPFANQRLESSVSHLQANQRIASEDLARLSSISAPSVGPTSASVTVVAFLDYGCPYCRKSSGAFREMILKYQDRVHFIVRDFPIEELHPTAMQAAIAARCAFAQDKGWAFHDALFAHQDQQTQEDLTRYALQAGVNEARFLECVQKKTPEPLIKQDLADGLRVGVQGTPTYFFNGVRVQGALDSATFDFLIQRFLKNPKGS
jgi:protein-disulfide isomerase